MKSTHGRQVLAGVFVLALALTAAEAAEILIFEETFDANAADEFFITDTVNYGDWSEFPPPSLTPYSSPLWPVSGNRLKPFTPIGAGSYPNTTVRQIPVPAAVATGRSALRITFDSEVLQGGTWNPGGGEYGCYQGVLLHDTIVYFHSAQVVFDARQYTDWYQYQGNSYASGSPAGVVNWNILIEQLGGGSDRLTVVITKGGDTFTNTWISSDGFQFVNGKLRFGFMGDDGSGASDVELAYDNLRVWQVPVGEELVFQEIFDADAADEFFSTAPANYGDWSEFPPPTLTPYSSPLWPVSGNRLKPFTAIGAGSYPNTAVRQIPVTSLMANGTNYPMRITFDSEVLQGGTYNPGGGEYGCYQGVLLHNTIVYFHSAQPVFSARQYTDWYALYEIFYTPGSPAGVVHWDILIEQLGGGSDRLTAVITKGGNTFSNTWTSSSAFQFVSGEFKFGFMGDDGSGTSDVELAYDNLQVWQVGLTPPPVGSVVMIR